MERKLKVLTLKVKDKPDTNEAELIIILREHTNSEDRTSLGTLSTTPRLMILNPQTDAL